MRMDPVSSSVDIGLEISSSNLGIESRWRSAFSSIIGNGDADGTSNRSDCILGEFFLV